MDPRSASKARAASAASSAALAAGYGGGGEKGSSSRGRDPKESKAERAARKEEERRAALGEEQEAKQGEAEEPQDGDAAGDGGAADDSGNEAEAEEEQADGTAAQLILLQGLLAESERLRAEAEAREAAGRAVHAKAVEALAKALGSTVPKGRKESAAQGNSDDEETALLKVAAEKAAELRTLEHSIRATRAARDMHKRQEAERRAGGGAGAPAPGRVAVAQQSKLSSPLASPPHSRRHGASAAFRALDASAGRTAAAPKIPAPKELTATEAARPEGLEDWIFTVERMLRGLQADTFTEQLEYASLYWDRAVQSWWTGAQLLAVERGQPVADWDAFVETLRANYSPVADADTAWRKLVSIRMGSAEQMETYVARAQELVNRIPQARLETHTAAEFLLAGVDGARFPITYAGMLQATQAARKVTGGRGLGFAEARAKLVEAASREPSLHWTRVGGSGSGGGSNHRAAGGAKTQVSAVATGGRYARLSGEEEEEVSDGEQAQRNLGAINLQEATCYRCHMKGHLANECKKPDPRKCYGCGGTGHLKKDCKAPAKSKGGAPGGPPGGTGAGKANSSKNE